MKTKIKTLVINRQKWIRGDEENSKLLRIGDRKMCCLGFYALFKGLKEEDILNLNAPAEILSNSHQIKELLDEEHYNNSLCYAMMRLNDDKRLIDLEREKKLKLKFKKINIKLKFIN